MRAGLSRRLCLWLGAGGVIMLSPDSLLLRLAAADDGVAVVVRSAFSVLTLIAAIALLPALRRGCKLAPVLLYGGCYALGLMCFPLSINNTHVANALVIIAAAPILSAIGAAFVLQEKTRPATWLAAMVIFVGMAVIFAGDMGAGGRLGDALAVAVALSLAGTSIVARRYPNTPMYPGLVLGGAAAALAFLPFAQWDGVSPAAVGWLGLDGAVVLTVSFLLIATAARGLPPAELNLLFLLETLLGPLWVWLALGENPPVATVAAGTLIVVVLALHAMWNLRFEKTSGG